MNTPQSQPKNDATDRRIHTLFPNSLIPGFMNRINKLDKVENLIGSPLSWHQVERPEPVRWIWILKSCTAFQVVWCPKGCAMRWIWIGFFIVACGTSSRQKIAKIDNQQLLDLLKDRNVQLLDVRTPEEVSHGKIPGALSIDYYDPQFASKIVKFDIVRPVVVYCAVGGRSAKAVAKLKELGFQEVYDLKGGMRSWKGAGYPIEH